MHSGKRRSPFRVLRLRRLLHLRTCALRPELGERGLCVRRWFGHRLRGGLMYWQRCVLLPARRHWVLLLLGYSVRVWIVSGRGVRAGEWRPPMQLRRATRSELRVGPRFAWLVAVALCAACGSRTGLIDPGVGVDSGGAGAGAVGATGGAGATGGVGAVGGTSGVAGCVALQQVDPVVAIQPGSASADFGPQAVASSDDGEQVSVAFIRSAAPGPASKSDVDAATFSPWLAWPPTGKLAPAVSLLPAVDFASDLRTGSSFGGRFALLLGQGPMLGFTPNIDPATGPVAPGVPLFTVGAPLFVARKPGCISLASPLWTVGSSSTSWSPAARHRK